MKLIVVTDADEQVEARCDGCARWNPFGESGFCDRVQQGPLAGTGMASKSPIRTSPDFYCKLFERKESA